MFCAHKSSYVYCRLACLTGAFKIILIQWYRISLEGHQIIYMCQIFFICKGAASFRKYKPMNIQSRYGNSENTHRNSYFLATKHEKTIMVCSYLNFYKYFLHFEIMASNTIKNESIHLNSWHDSHKKQKDSLETQVVLLIFLLELEMSGVTVQRIHQNSKKWQFL